ncbi:hypothetical protein HK099_006270 [Clydaea vesicula]|uniref:Uncharacterized protein n=1 Tax=Clydaea vesicula TaxID=447962 RepID=A0AAD5U828_9FUNG|nr:hypothetical protein HK099_006270 [Clydaea vesicula]KAJ3397093.1 hypothetical protein HDU92_000793 [Lobulomyces angularis]
MYETFSVLKYIKNYNSSGAISNWVSMSNKNILVNLFDDKLIVKAFVPTEYLLENMQYSNLTITGDSDTYQNSVAFKYFNKTKDDYLKFHLKFESNVTCLKFYNIIKKYVFVGIENKVFNVEPQLNYSILSHHSSQNYRQIQEHSTFVNSIEPNITIKSLLEKQTEEVSSYTQSCSTQQINVNKEENDNFYLQNGRLSINNLQKDEIKSNTTEKNVINLKRKLNAAESSDIVNGLLKLTDVEFKREVENALKIPEFKNLLEKISHIIEK